MVTPPENTPGARIAAAEAAFEHGDYRVAGTIARTLLENEPAAGENPDLPLSAGNSATDWADAKQRAARLQERLRPDPLIKLLLAGSALLLLTLVLISYGMNGGR